MKLPYQIRKKMQIGGTPDFSYKNPFTKPKSLIQDGFQPLKLTNGQITPSVQASSYQPSYSNFKKDNPISLQNGQIDNGKSILGNYNTNLDPTKSSNLGLTYGDLMYGANVGLMALSQGYANNQTQQSINAQIGNPLNNMQFNDGRSQGVQYGYQQYQQGGNIQNQNTNTMNEHAILTAYLQQVPPNQRQAIMKQLAQLKQSNPQKYQQTLQQLGQSMQQAQGQEQMPQARYGRYMQEGGMQDQQQDQGQQEGSPQDQGQDQQGQMIQKVAQMLQQGASPQQVVAQLVKMGMSQDQATQLVQQVMQQMQGQQQQPQAQEQPQGGQPMAQYGMYMNENNYMQQGGSLVDFLAKKGQRFDMTSRKELAERMGISNYKGTAQQNQMLLSYLDDNPFSKPMPSPGFNQFIQASKPDAIDPRTMDFLNASRQSSMDPNTLGFLKASSTKMKMGGKYRKMY